MAFTGRGPCLEAPGPARPSCHESRTDGRDHRPHTTLHPPLRRDPFLLSHIVVLESPSHVRQFWGFFTGFRGEPTRPSGFHRSLPVVTISPPLSRIHVGGFTFFGFSAERCTRLSRRWWRWFGGRTQTQAPGAWLMWVRSILPSSRSFFRTIFLSLVLICS